ncbi:MAG: hypothetical protein IJA62_05855 [Ruminococcus sp.]|nr:hypothetical protein [Ruminococcus sp.]
MDWPHSDKMTFYYYNETEGDMVKYPGVEGAFDALRGGYSLMVPAQAKCISIVDDNGYDTKPVAMPEKDGMTLVPIEKIYNSYYEAQWQ